MNTTPAPEFTAWEKAFEQGRALGYDYGESCDYADSVTQSAPVKINPDADFDARAYRLGDHAEGLRANDPITLASVFRILIHAADCPGCHSCLIDGN
jgi:cytochrome c556